MVPFRMIAKLMKKGYEQIEKSKGVDVLINCAGINELAGVEEMTDEQIEKSKYIGEIEGKRNNGYEWWYEYDRKQPVCNRTY